MKNQWNNMPCKLVVELEIKDDVIVNVSQDSDASKIKECLKGIPNGDAELIIELLASGYYEPMSMYGGPDNLGWPAEGGNDFELDRVYVIMDGKTYPVEDGKTIYDYFYDEIFELEGPYES